MPEIIFPNIFIFIFTTSTTTVLLQKHSVDVIQFTHNLFFEIFTCCCYVTNILTWFTLTFADESKLTKVVTMNTKIDIQIST